MERLSMMNSVATPSTQTIENTLKDAENIIHKQILLERESVHSSLVSLIKAIMLEKNREMKEHSERLIDYCTDIGRRLNLSNSQMYEAELLAITHDIGKICIDGRILTSPNRLTKEEWAEMKKHPEVGYRIALASPVLIPIAKSILYHHERWDGKGYPQGLKGNKIPLLARIIAVIDAYDAMVNDRSYRKALLKDAAIKEIAINSGLQFDPKIVKVFLEAMNNRDYR
jgi:HD-GYP domain-containing protein (c-di-GMP phosphodiesterase class II)